MVKVLKDILYILPPLLWMALIYYLSSFNRLQASEIGWQDFVLRKGAHFAEYAILFVLIYRAFNFMTRLSLADKLFFTFFLTVLYALTDEYHQTWVLGRTGKLFDVMVDTSGAVFGFVFSAKLIYRLPISMQRFILKKS
ncbi:VanZ family protein [Candidatus Microgenomates bacterium]|jgi:VanZ family protein|nr:MAG: VanZ family protein [Candidatus Microgenomates bacterium]